MLKILLALLLLSTPAWATQWRGGTGENSVLGTSNASDIDYNTYNSIVKPLDDLLYNYCNQYLTYTSSTTLTASAGGVTVSNSQGTIRLMLKNTTPTLITWGNLDTGAQAANTTYYVYATAATNSATTSTYYISASNTAPSGQTYYYQIGSFTTDSSTNITAIMNNGVSGGFVGTATSKTVGVVYQALTDGNIVGYTTRTTSNNGYRIYTDSTSSPTTKMMEGFTLWVSGGGDVSVVINYPIRKGDYYKVVGLNVSKVEDSNGIPVLNFIPTSK